MPHVAEVGTAVTNSLRATGAVEGINTFVWLATAATARFDATSHIIPSYQIGSDCNVYATKPVPACSAHWAGSAADRAQAAAKRTRHRKRARRHRNPAAEGVTDVQEGDTPADAAQPAKPLPSLPQLPDLPPLPGVKPPALPGGGDDGSAEKLLDFLMGK
jgi:hypothetical protein